MAPVRCGSGGSSKRANGSSNAPPAVSCHAVKVSGETEYHFCFLLFLVLPRVVGEGDSCRRRLEDDEAGGAGEGGDGDGDGEGERARLRVVCLERVAMIGEELERFGPVAQN